MRPHHRFVRVVSILVLFLLFGGAFPARFVPTVQAAGLWYVSQTGDDTHDCLSPAAACATINGALDKIAPGDTILIDDGVYIAPTTGGSEANVTDDYSVVSISKEVILSGGWNADFTSQTGYTTVDGQTSRTGINISFANALVTIQRFKVQNSNIGIRVDTASLTLDQSIILNNHAYTFAGGIYLTSSPALTVLNSTIFGNQSNETGGIGIGSGNPVVIIHGSAINANTGDYGAVNAAFGTVFIENTTINGNTGMIAGGISTGNSNYVKIYNSSITANSATFGGSSGGILANSTHVQLNNTLLAGNTSPSGPDCLGSLTSAGYNLIGDLSSCGVTLQTGDISGVDPVLGPLEGSPGYQTLLPASPAVDAGDPSGCLGIADFLIATDQGGHPRVGRCDIGAYELQPLGYSDFSVDQAQAHPGQLLTFTASLRTGGSDPLSGVTLANTLPAGLTYLPNSLQASSGEALYSAGQVTWSGDLVPASPVTLSYQARAGAAGAADVKNPVLITSAAETVSRSALVSITPWTTYLPAVNKPCPLFFADNFTDPKSGWPTINTKNYVIQYLPGEYQLLLKVPGNALMVRAPSVPLPNDFEVNVDVRNVNGILGSGGLIFGAVNDWSTYYTFEILPDQTWYVWRWNGSYWENLASDYSSVIRTGGQTNSLRIRHDSTTFNFSINNQSVGTFYSPYDFSGRFVGVISQSINKAPLDVRFSNFFMPDTSCTLTGLQSAAPVHPGGFLSGPSAWPAPGK